MLNFQARTTDVPVVKTHAKGASINFTIVADNGYYDKGKSEWVQKSSFFSCKYDFWDSQLKEKTAKKVCELISQKMEKGGLVLIDATPCIDEYEDQSGNKKFFSYLKIDKLSILGKAEFNNIPTASTGFVFGHLGKDAEKIGSSIVKGSIAIKQGSKTTWLDWTMFLNSNFNKTDHTEKFKKGTKVCFQGFLVQEKWEKDGQKKSKMSFTVNKFSIVKEEEEKENYTPPPMAETKDKSEPETGTSEYGEDDLPF